MAHDEPKFNVVIDPAANDRMYEHIEFVARVSERAATRLLDDLIKDMRSLESMPYRNPVYNRPYLPGGKYRYLVSNERYLIVYQIENNTVFIDDIQDSRQSDSKSLLYDK